MRCVDMTNKYSSHSSNRYRAHIKVLFIEGHHILALLMPTSFADLVRVPEAPVVVRRRSSFELLLSLRLSLLCDIPSCSKASSKLCEAEEV